MGIKKLPVLLQAVFLRSLTAHIPSRGKNFSTFATSLGQASSGLDFRLFTHQRKKHYIVMGKICQSKKGSEKRNCGIKKLPVLLQAVFLRSLTAHIPQRVRISALLLLRSVKRLVLDFRLFLPTSA
jgi:hypothetical protein